MRCRTFGLDDKSSAKNKSPHRMQNRFPPIAPIAWGTGTPIGLVQEAYFRLRELISRSSRLLLGLHQMPPGRSAYRAGGYHCAVVWGAGAIRIGVLETGLDAVLCHYSLSEHVRLKEELQSSYAWLYSLSGRRWSHGGPARPLNRSKSLGRNPWCKYTIQGHPWGPATEVTVKHK